MDISFGLFFLSGLFFGILMMKFLAPTSEKSQDFRSRSAVYFYGFLGEIYDQYTQQTLGKRLIFKMVSQSKTPVTILHWIIILKDQHTHIKRAVEYRPQNCISVLKPDESFTFEITDLTLFHQECVDDIILRTKDHGQVHLSPENLNELIHEIRNK